MLLYDVKRGSFIKVEDLILHFHHLDGQYSFCTTERGDVVHIKASAEVEVIPMPVDWRADESE